MPFKCNCSASPSNREALLKGPGLYYLDPKPPPSNQPESKRENSCQIQVEGLGWVGDEACNKIQVLVTKSLSFALAIKSGQNNSGT